MKSKSVQRTACALGLCALAACTVNLAFDITKDAAVVASADGLSVAVPVDLGSSKEVQDHKAEVQSLSLESLDLTVTGVAAGNRATSISGRVALRAEGAPEDGSQDVEVGTLSDFPVMTGSFLHIPGSSKLDQFLFDQIQGSGRFSAVIAGSTQGGRTDATIRVVLHASLGYGAGF